MQVSRRVAIFIALTTLMVASLIASPIASAMTAQPRGGDNSQWVSQSQYPIVMPSQQFTVSFTFLNDGTTTWSDAGGYALACDTVYHSDSASNNDCMGGSPVGFNGQSVSPGQQFTFTLALTAPDPWYGIGNGIVENTWWDMEHNGSIFGNNNVFLGVTILPQQDLNIGEVEVSPASLQLYDANGNTLPARCPNLHPEASDSNGNAILPADWDVVVLADLPSSTTFTVPGYQSGGEDYTLVAYPDPCERGLDFSDNTAIANGTGAIGYIDSSQLQQTSYVVPANPNANTDWHDCWVPTGCRDANFISYINAGGVTYLNAPDGGPLFAWVNGTTVNPRWWEVLSPDHSGNAAVYGRDWMAY